MDGVQAKKLMGRVRRAVEEIEDPNDPRAICMICRRLGVSWTRIEAYAIKLIANNRESDEHG
jgi:hypothetical protein